MIKYLLFVPLLMSFAASYADDDNRVLQGGVVINASTAEQTQLEGKTAVEHRQPKPFDGYMMMSDPRRKPDLKIHHYAKIN